MNHLEHDHATRKMPQLPAPKTIALLVATLFCAPQLALADCSGITTRTTGVLAGGINFGSPVSGLVLQNATANGSVILAPASGCTGSVTLNNSSINVSSSPALQVNTSGSITISTDAGSSITDTSNSNSNSGTVQATTSSGSITINNAGQINAYSGIHANNTGTGSIAITTGSITTTGGNPITAVSSGNGSSLDSGNINITTTTGSVVQTQGGVAISASSNGSSGDININTNGTVTAVSGQAISANSNGGNIKIQSNGDVSASVFTIAASNNGTGNIDIISRGTVTNLGGVADYADAMAIRSNGGAVNIDTSEATLNAGRGLVVESSNGSLKVNSGSVNAKGSDGMDLYYTGNNSSASGIIASTAAGTNVEAGGWGLAAWSQGSNGGVSITTNGTFGAQQAIGATAVSGGITQANNNDNVQMQVNGAVNAVRTAVQGTTAGSGTVNISSNAALTSQKGIGINAAGNGGQVSVQANAAVSGATAIRGSSVGGNVVLLANANTTGTGSNSLGSAIPTGVALLVTTAQHASIDNYAYATTLSNSAAVVDVSTSGNATLNNHAGATLSGASDLAINSRAGATTINNDGTIIGYVTLQGSGNVFNNNSSNSFDMRNYVAGVQSVASAVINGDFNNNANGVLRVLNVASPQSVNNSGAYQPAGSLLPTTSNGVVQGQLLGSANFTNAGTITLQGRDNGAGRAIAGDVLVITGSQSAGTSGGGTYTANGGQLRIDTLLNQGGKASLSDMLVVDRTAVASGGATKVYVANAGGLGGFTGNGSNDGIEVVKVLDSGNSASNAFSLGAPVTAGAFQYQLRQADGQNWYLQTNDVAPAAKVQAILPVALAEIGLNNIGTLWQRVGDRRYQANLQAEADRPAVWARTGGRSGDSDGQISGAGFAYATSYRLDSDFVQIGADRGLWHNAKGELIGSLLAEYGDSRMSLRDGSNGSADITNQGAGLALTWYGNNGYYLDAVGKWSHYRTQLSTDGNSGSPAGNGSLFSLETGYQYALNPKWSMVPQLQLVWQNNRLDGFTDATGVNQQSNADHSLNGRLGVAWRYADPAAQGRGFNGYVKADLLHSFQSGALTVFSDTPLALQVARSSGEIGVGGNWSNQARTVDAYAEVNYRHSLGGDSSQSIGGVVGVRYHW